MSYNLAQSVSGKAYFRDYWRFMTRDPCQEDNLGGLVNLVFQDYRHDAMLTDDDSLALLAERIVELTGIGFGDDVRRDLTRLKYGGPTDEKRTWAITYSLRFFEAPIRAKRRRRGFTSARDYAEYIERRILPPAPNGSKQTYRTLNEGLDPPHPNDTFRKSHEEPNPKKSQHDGANHCPSIVQLADTRWVSEGANTKTRNISTELFCFQVQRQIGDVTVRFGLREVWIGVRAEGGLDVYYFRPGERGLPRYAHYFPTGDWKLTGQDVPQDMYGMLDGSILKNSICEVKLTEERDEHVQLTVFASKIQFRSVAILPETGDAMSLEDEKRIRLVEVLYDAYLAKLNGYRGEFNLLCSNTLKP